MASLTSINSINTDYDDVKGIYSSALDSVSKPKVDEFKAEITQFLNKEKDNEALKSRLSRRSTRIKESGGLRSTTDEEPNLLGFYVLMRILKIFREEHKNELFKFDTLEVDQVSNSIYKNSCASYGKSSVANNKRIAKELYVETQAQKGNLLFIFISYLANFYI